MAKWKWKALPCPLCGQQELIYLAQGQIPFWLCDEANTASFFLPNGEYRRAADMFDQALAIGEGDAGDYYQAAVARAMLDDGA